MACLEAHHGHIRTDQMEAHMPGTVPPVADEREGLLAFLAQQRDAIRFTAFGLTDEEARRTPTAGALSIGGLVKHVAAMERGWIDNVLLRTRSAEEEASYDRGFTLGEDETLADALADLVAAGRETEEAINAISDLGQAVPVPDAPWFPKDVEAWSVRWVLLHLIEEVARHAGHADIVRESIDGATCYELLAAAEGWPATEWLQPWERVATVA
jgi:uncharacterized damage-inducible protein DinB